MTTSDKAAQLVLDNLREIPDFPEPGILFRDITPLLANGEAFGTLIKLLADRYRGKVDEIAGLESRGFILAAPLAVELGIGMIAIRKAGKLPGPVLGIDYELEYGSARMEIRPDSVQEGNRILILDDVLATGGTAKAAKQLIEQSGGVPVGICVLMELTALQGRNKVSDIPVDALLSF